MCIRDSFHPNPYENWDNGNFGGMPELSHRNPYVFGEILKLARWLVEEIGFDGFRYDFVKGFGAATIQAMQEYRYTRNGEYFAPYGVAEYWDSTSSTLKWVDMANFSNSNPVDAFDFPLREMFKALCDQYGFSLKNLITWESVAQNQPQSVVTFVENHDLRDEGRPIVNDKFLAYSYILTHEGYPCVFWHDYFNLNLGLDGTPHGIAALVGFMPGGVADELSAPLAGLPVFMAVGRRDPLIPLTQAHACAAILRTLGAELAYHEYDSGHKLDARGMRDLQAWWRDRAGS